MPSHLSTYGTQIKECTSPEMALWRWSDHGAVFQLFFQKHFSYLCEYAIRFALSCSFSEYSNIFHCLHCSPSCFDPDSLLLAYLWLGLSWIGCISANKTFYSSKTSSRKPYTSSKQQERHKHSVEITIKRSVQDTLKPLIPPHGSPVTIGSSPHRVQANHLIRGPTHTLDGVIS